MACDEFHLRENAHWLRDGVDVLIGQPKRVWQLHSNGLLSLAQVQHLVLDAHSGPANEAFQIVEQTKGQTRQLIVFATAFTLDAVRDVVHGHFATYALASVGESSQPGTDSVVDLGSALRSRSRYVLPEAQYT